MNEKVVDIDVARRSRQQGVARISRGLRNLSRERRREMLSSRGYSALCSEPVTAEQYAGILRAHYAVRKTLEELLESLGGVFQVKNISTGEEKLFAVHKYATASRARSSQLYNDIVALTGFASSNEPLPSKAQELIDYMARVKVVYSAGLLGVLYMLEETVAYAGPRIADNLDRQLRLSGKATRYLRGSGRQKADLWEFRRSLDLITDFQTQVNVVAASTITYGMYRDLLNLGSVYSPRRSTKLN